MAKQVLQLGMGDAFDDWLMEKIQLLRRGSVVASGIKRVEEVTKWFLSNCKFMLLVLLNYIIKIIVETFRDRSQNSQV